MFKERYQKLHNSIVPDETMISNVIRRAQQYECKQRLSGWQRGLCAAAAIICVMPLAAASSTGYQVMYAVSPQATQFFTPVQRADEDQGIRMEVESASVHGNTVEVYVSFQDLEGSRIDGTTDLYDSYSIGRPFSSAGCCFFDSFDEETGKARFLISITEWENQKITGKKVTFSVRGILSGKKIYDHIDIPIELSAVPDVEKTQQVYACGGGGLDYPQDRNDFRSLVPGRAMKEFPVEGIDLTGIGYIDGSLHLQTAVCYRNGMDNHGYFYLTDKAGNTIHSNYTFGFRENEETENRIDYNNYIFDIPRDEIGQYTLHGWFSSGGTLTKGDWRVTFPIEQAP